MPTWRPSLATVVVVIAVIWLLPRSMVAGPEKASSFPPNTWVNMQAGGVVSGQGVGDEGFNTFVYSPGLGKGIVFGLYHGRALSWGEDQNALLGYDFSENRWDLLEVTDAAWSEFLPGVGHDQGNATIDPVHDLYISRGNMTLHGNTAYQTYIYDLKAGRGKRMMPAREPDVRSQVAMAFSPDHDVAVISRGPSWFYRPQMNVWTPIPNSPPHRDSPAMVYDQKHRVFVMFGGGYGNETWTLDPATSAWARKTPASSPPPRNSPSMAYDAANGVVLMVGGAAKGQVALFDIWIYDAGLDTWTPLPAAAPRGTNTDAGNNLIYDTRNRVFLLKSSVDLKNVWAFRYSPSSTRSEIGPATPRSRAWGVRLAALQNAQESRLRLPLETWVARPLPGIGRGPTPGQHQPTATATAAAPPDFGAPQGVVRR